MASRNLFAFAMLSIVMIAPWAAPSPAVAEETPQAIVARLNATLISVMREAETLGYEGRFVRLAPVLEEIFDFSRMAGISVGRHWRKLDDAQREQFVETFRRMSIATFAARFSGFSGERFQILGEEQAPRKAVLVRNQLVKRDGEAVGIDYLLRPGADGWRVIDVFLDAKYSELAMKRSEYSSVFDKEGFEGLVNILEAKIAKLADAG